MTTARAEALRAGTYAGALLAAAGAIAVATGRPFVFPSLGPSAYLFATVRRGEVVAARRVLGGHLLGVVAGLLAHHLLAPGLVVTSSAPPFAPGLASLAAAGILSVALTTGGMLLTDTVHPPACATTLIVSLGILPTIVDGGIIVVSVALISGIHAAARRAGIV